MNEESFIVDPRDWITGPFSVCPSCGADELGLLMVARRGYVKRCRACMESERHPLPRLRKQVLYLDQFAISNLMKVLHPDQRHRIERRGEPEERFWTELFDRLERLVKLGVLICPWSGAHWEESFVDARFAALRRIYEHLAGEVRFKSRTYIHHGQILNALAQWLEPGSGRGWIERRHALEGNLDGWTAKMQVQARLDPDAEVADELRNLRGQAHVGLAAAVRKWRQSGRRGFDAYFAEEVNCWGELQLQAYARRLGMALEVAAGEREIHEEILFSTPPQILIEAMKSKLAEHGVAHDDQIATLRRFFGSPQMQAVPFLRISAGMLAALAVKASLHQAPEPDRGMVTDIDVVSTCLPYCDALFIDGRCAELLEGAAAELDLARGVPIFTPASRQTLLDWLAAREAAVSAAHTELVERVYGSGWLKPYRSIFTAEPGGE